MTAENFAKGVVLGFAIAAPIGPVSLLCIRRTIFQGRLVGLLSGLGAACADALAGGVAAFALSLVSELLVAHGRWVHRIVGAVLFVVGARLALRPAAVRSGTDGSAVSCFAALSSTFLLTLANPATILSFTLTLAALGLAGEGDGRRAVLVGVSVFCGATLWWVLLCGGARAVAGVLGGSAVARFDRLTGLGLAAFGLISLFAVA